MRGGVDPVGQSMDAVPAGDLADVWRGFVEGRWEIVEQYDRQGRRCFVAVRSASPRLRLSPREREVCGRVALGESNKVIAFELGLSAPTVAGYVASAVVKLRAGSRVRLIAIWNAVASPGACELPGHLSLVPPPSACRSISR